MNSAVHSLKKSLRFSTKQKLVLEKNNPGAHRHVLLRYKNHFHHLQRSTHLLQVQRQILASFFFFGYHRSRCSACLQMVYQSVKCSDKKCNYKPTYTGLLLSASCRRNCLAEKEVITGWILAGDHSVKNNKRLLGYAHTMI